MLFLRAGCSRNNGGTPFCASVPHLSEDAFMTNVVKMWNSAFTDRTDVEYRQAIHFLSSSSWRKLILPQTVLCLTSRKKEKCFWTWTKIAKRWEKKEKEAWPERWNDVQSAVSPCAKSPPPPPIDTVFVSNMESVAAYNQKRQIVAAVFALRVPTLFFWGDTRDRERERRMDEWRESSPPHHTSGTDGNLQAAWRQEHAQPQVAMGTGGYMASWTDTQTSLPLPRFERSADRYVSVAKKKKKGKAGGDLNLSCLHPSTSLWSWNVLLLSLQSQLLQKKEKGWK